MAPHCTSLANNYANCHHVWLLAQAMSNAWLELVLFLSPRAVWVDPNISYTTWNVDPRACVLIDNNTHAVGLVEQYLEAERALCEEGLPSLYNSNRRTYYGIPWQAVFDIVSTAKNFVSQHWPGSALAMVKRLYPFCRDAVRVLRDLDTTKYPILHELEADIHKTLRITELFNQMGDRWCGNSLQDQAMRAIILKRIPISLLPRSIQDRIRAYATQAFPTCLCVHSCIIADTAIFEASILQKL